MMKSICKWLAVLILVAFLPGVGLVEAEEINNEPQLPIGDIDCDGYMNIGDSLLVRDLIFGVRIPTAAQTEQIKRIRPDGRPTLRVLQTIRDLIFGFLETSLKPITDDDLSKIHVDVSPLDTVGNQKVTLSFKDYRPPEYLLGMQMNLEIPKNLCTYVSSDIYYLIPRYIEYNSEILLITNSGLRDYFPHNASVLCSINVRPKSNRLLAAADFPITCLEMISTDISNSTTQPAPSYDPSVGIWIKGDLSNCPYAVSISVVTDKDFGKSIYNHFEIGVGNSGNPTISPGKDLAVKVYVPITQFNPYCTILQGETDMNAVVEGDYLVFDTDSLGTFTVASPPKGDINRDLHINITDILLLRDIIFGDAEATDYILWAADATEPGDINIKTILWLRDIIFC